MKRTAILMATLLANPATVWASDQARQGGSDDRMRARPGCQVEVLYSEELPGAPIFQNRVRAWLQITPPRHPPFEVTVERFVPWQMPPPRRGQRLRLGCDARSLDLSVF